MENLKTLLSKLPQVALSPEGVFKYILIQVSHKGETIEFVRGHASLEYHAQNFDRFVKEFNDAKLMLNGEPLKANHNVEVKCPGGGRVKHSGRPCLMKLLQRLFPSTATRRRTDKATTTAWPRSCDRLWTTLPSR